MSYLTPEELIRLLKRVFYVDADGRVYARIAVDDVGLAKEATLAHVTYTGAHRLKLVRYYSGSVTVSPATTVSTLSVSGIGRFHYFMRHYSSGVPAGNAELQTRFDASIGWEAQASWGISAFNYFGLTATGFHFDGVLRTHRWDTVNHVYWTEVYNRTFPIPFRLELLQQLYNSHATDTATMSHVTYYSVFTASRHIVVKLPKWVDAPALREKSGVKELMYPLVVHRLGYFEDEALHPYREYLEDLPNRWDKERTLPDGTVIRGASERIQNFVAEVYAPEEVPKEKALGRIKPVKILHEEVV